MLVPDLGLGGGVPKKKVDNFHYWQFMYSETDPIYDSEWHASALEQQEKGASLLQRAPLKTFVVKGNLWRGRAINGLVGCSYMLSKYQCGSE